MEVVVSEKTVQEKMEIKPCPWCGSTKLEFCATEGIGGWYMSYYVRCKSCEAKGQNGAIMERPVLNIESLRILEVGV